MASEAWELEFAEGTVTTTRIDSDVEKGGKTADGASAVSFVLERDEAIIVEESLNRLAAVRVREVPDGPNIPEDANSDDRNTIQVVEPDDLERSEEFLLQRTYVVTEYETELINNEFFQITLSLFANPGKSEGFGHTFGEGFGT